MSGLLEELAAKALAKNIPMGVHMDLTCRCNERCVHCYLDHDDPGELTTAEIKRVLADEFCALADPADESSLSALPCSSGHTSCYLSPHGDVFPGVQFSLPTGKVRKQRFIDLGRISPLNEVGSIRLKGLTTCPSCSHVGSCTRCPGLAYMEGNLRGPSSQDCEKSFARTGVRSANRLAKKRNPASLAQIRIMPSFASPPAGALV